MTAAPPIPVSSCRLFKVGLAVPTNDHICYCVGLGVGPSEDGFREWLHRRILLSQLPFLSAQIEPLQLDQGSGDLERLMHMVAYASGCSPFRQVFWIGDEISLPDSSERFLQGVAAGETTISGGSCALLLAGKAISDLNLAGPIPSAPSEVAAQPRPRSDKPVRMAADRPLPWIAALQAMLGAMRRKLAYLWMTW